MVESGMATIRARFDGKVFVPEGPVDWEVGATVDVHLNAAAEALRQCPPDHPNRWLLQIAAEAPLDPDSPGDRAAQHDHYLYGTPKREL